jgi:uncharacterized protein (DUF58 family)
MWWKFRKPKQEKSSNEADELRTSGRAPLSEVAKKVQSIEILTKKKSSVRLAGEYRSRFKGQGMQFADARIYQYGDDIRHIDWRTSARMPDTYIKTFEEERELHIWLVVDSSASMIFGSTGQTKQETAALAMATLGFSALRNNDRMGLVFFSDEVERVIKPKKGRKHLLRVIDELVSYPSKGKSSSFQGPLELMLGMLKHPSIIVMCSDFFGTIDQKLLNQVGRKHDFIALVMSDPRDEELPNVGLIEFEDPETGEQRIVQTGSSSFRQDYRTRFRKERQKNLDALKTAGAGIVQLTTNSDIASKLQAFFAERRRR